MNRPFPLFNKVIPFEKNNGKGFQIKAKSPDKGEIWIYEEIDAYWGMGPKEFAKELKALGSIKEIDVRINSPGGYVYDGIAIYNLLKQHSATVNVYIDGIAASIASVIAMAGDTISMADNATLMIHNAWTIAVGDSEMLREAAELLDQCNAQIVKAYMTKASVDEQTIVDMMTAETWMDADEALSCGLITNIVDKIEAAAKWDLKKFKYRNVPESKSPSIITGDVKSTRQKLAKMNLRTGKIRRPL